MVDAGEEAHLGWPQGIIFGQIELKLKSSILSTGGAPCQRSFQRSCLFPEARRLTFVGGIGGTQDGNFKVAQIVFVGTGLDARSGLLQQSLRFLGQRWQRGCATSATLMMRFGKSPMGEKGSGGGRANAYLFVFNFTARHFYAVAISDSYENVQWRMPTASVVIALSKFATITAAGGDIEAESA